MTQIKKSVANLLKWRMHDGDEGKDFITYLREGDEDETV